MPLSTNHNLEELFDLPAQDKSDSVDETVTDNPKTNLPIVSDSLDALDKIEQALPAVKGLEASDVEMDELAAKASESFDNLMDLGMQVDSRYASEIFAVAGTMLGHAITAKTAKLNKKLKMIDLQLKKAKMDQSTGGEDAPATAEGRVLDRNELLRMLAPRTNETPPSGK